MRRPSLVGAIVKSLLFTVVTLAATAVLALTIVNGNVGGGANYSAVFTDVTGLQVGDTVRIAGVRVGQVTDIRIADRRLAEVRFSVEPGRRLPVSVTAAVKYLNLLGQRYVDLRRGTGAVDETMPLGGTIPLSQTTPALDLTALFDGFQPLFQALSPKDVNKLSTEIVAVLQGDGTTVTSLIASTATLTTALASRDRVIGQVITNLNAVLDTVNGGGGQLSELIVTLRQLVSGLAADRQPIGDAVSGIAALSTSTASLLQLGRPGLRQSIASLGKLSNTLANNTPTVDSFLTNLPTKLSKIGTLGSYGSWLNFYLCEATVTGVSSSEPGIPPPTGVPIKDARCLASPTDNGVGTR
ncbi:MCE family protein [Fodinicola acaciae]|uniref:MCE family protein n=1 Tax=Fodinicola acaciae TaxID=2681555 RepID=UPI0013D197CE|nr:MlaD family protein [Fodinicola acaciae]